MYQIELKRSPGITEEERRRRMHQVYEILLSAARKKANDAPVSELGNLDERVETRQPKRPAQRHATPERDLAQVAEV